MTPFDLLDVYKKGYFPMAEHREDSQTLFYAPETRALLPIKDLHIPKRLKRKMQHVAFEVRIDTAFAEVIQNCADIRDTTWINDEIITAFKNLHDMGVAHSVETWLDGKLVGGLYGLTLGSTFCGESMFSTVTDASKVALIHLCQHLDKQGFKLLDSQFRNPHLDQFGLYEIPQSEYMTLLREGLKDKVTF